MLLGADSHPGKLRDEHVPGMPLTKTTFPAAFCTSQENILFSVFLGEKDKSQHDGDQESPGKEEQSSTKGLGLLHPWWQPEQGGGFVCLGTGYEFTSATLV